MAGPTKKPRKPSEGGDSSDDYDSDESGSYHGQQEIQATFEGRNLEGQDFHGIKQLLQQLFLTAHIDLSQMSDLLIAQHGVGSVLKQSYNDSDDDEDVDMVEESDVFGITSVLNLTSHKETPCVQQFFKLIEDMSKNSSDDAQQIRQILQQYKVGLIINERFLNIPSKISAPMLNSLQDELNRIRKKEQSYNFDYYLMISKAWKPKGNTSDDLSFANDEEQIFLTQADYSFNYCVNNSGDTGLTGNWKSEDKEVIPYRVVILFKNNKFDGIVNAVKNFVQV